MRERIKSIMEHTKLSQQEFCNKTGISASSLSSIFSGRSNPTNNHVTAIHKAFPEVNVNWLLFGEGEPYLITDGQIPSELSASDPSASSDKTVFDMSGAVSEGTSVESSSAKQEKLQEKLLQKLLEKQSESPEPIRRKITEIRVFFDDGTYETFSAK